MTEEKALFDEASAKNPAITKDKEGIMISDNTSHLKLPLPHENNYLYDDVPRLRDALNGVDLHAQGTDWRLDAAERDLTTKADAAGTDAALLAVGQRLDQVAAELAGGIPTLSDAVDSAVSSVAASSLAVKTAFDKGAAAQAKADAALLAAGQGFIAGGIVPFSGTFGGSDGKRPIPRGKTVADETWVLCDGTNGTPDLRDRFIVGAGGKYAKDSKAGSETHAHTVSGSAGSATLSTSQMPSHGHSLTMYQGAGMDGSGKITLEDAKTWWVVNFNTEYAGGSSSHAHSLSASASAANGLPPYYALSYIMKL